MPKSKTDREKSAFAKLGEELIEMEKECRMAGICLKAVGIKDGNNAR